MVAHLKIVKMKFFETRGRAVTDLISILFFTSIKIIFIKSYAIIFSNMAVDWQIKTYAKLIEKLLVLDEEKCKKIQLRTKST